MEISDYFFSTLTMRLPMSKKTILSTRKMSQLVAFRFSVSAPGDDDDEMDRLLESSNEDIIRSIPTNRSETQIIYSVDGEEDVVEKIIDTIMSSKKIIKEASESRTIALEFARQNSASGTMCRYFYDPENEGSFDIFGEEPGYVPRKMIWKILKFFDFITKVTESDRSPLVSIGIDTDFLGRTGTNMFSDILRRNADRIISLDFRTVDHFELEKVLLPSIKMMTTLELLGTISRFNFDDEETFVDFLESPVHINWSGSNTRVFYPSQRKWPILC